MMTDYRHARKRPITRSWDTQSRHLANGKSGEKIEPFKAKKRRTFDRILRTDYQRSLRSLKWVERSKIVDADEECDTRHLEIVCKFGKVPRTADIVKYLGKPILPFLSYKEGSKTSIFNKYADMKKSQRELERLEWVESCQIVDANKECNKRHLEIVYKFGQVPRIADVVKLFGGEIHPLITYKEGSKTKWFETSIFDENFEMKEEFENGLSSLPWVKYFHIDFDNEQEKTWQIYITCAQSKAPSMVELKKIFGVNISSFVDFIQESVDEDIEGNKKSLLPSGFLGGPKSGDEIHNEIRSGTVATLAVRSFPSIKHYAITCYHVCHNGKLPKDLFRAHHVLKGDYEKGSAKCVSVVFKANTGEVLGKFSCGLYNDRHDIALIALENDLNCDDAVAFLQRNGIEPELASKREVVDIYTGMGGQVPVVKFGSVTTGRRGTLLSPLETKSDNGAHRGFYRIKGAGNEDFAQEGDSGSLVYLIRKDGKKIPFAFLSHVHKGVYYCPNLKSSLEALRPDIKPCLRECSFQ